MELLTDLEFLWFVAFVLLLTGYALLDGFDLGVGIIHLFSSKDEERRLMLNAIGPVWDGNEVWLVTAGGALFAGFPIAYATICSAFYEPVMILLAGIIFRAVAIEFRSKMAMSWWRWMWDLFFSLASLVIALGLGLVVGNLIHGLPMDEHHRYTGNFYNLIHPYALLVSAMTVALFTVHGAIYLLMKTEAELHDKVRSWINPLIITFIILYAITTVATLIYHPHMVETIRSRPLYFLIVCVNILAIANIPREIHLARDGCAFASSCANLICLMALYGLGTFPRLVRSIDQPESWSLDIYNSASSSLTLQILLLIALIGLPLVISYTCIVYWVFHGKVKLDSHSY